MSVHLKTTPNPSHVHINVFLMKNSYIFKNKETELRKNSSGVSHVHKSFERVSERQTDDASYLLLHSVSCRIKCHIASGKLH